MPSHLNGLNVIHPPQPEGDAQDLLSGASFPDLTAQLALWTNLPFESEEGSSLSQHGDKFSKHSSSEDDVEERPGMVLPESHVNVVTGTNVEQQHFPHIPMQQQPFNLNSLLSGFSLPQQQQGMSIAQLLALHQLTQSNPMFSTPPQQQQMTPTVLTQQQQSRTASSPSLSSSVPSSTSDVSPPPAKRPRTRKTSVSVADSPVDPVDGPVTTVAAAEDKRRRNTAASARFRLKKKERESALENKAKELDVRVNELERECEALRRENGWLKGLVVGVTGAQSQNQPVLAGVRRSREDGSS